MKKLFYPILLIIVVHLACNTADDKPFSASVEILSPEADSLIDSKTIVEELVKGFSWAEGPVWVNKLNALLFSDVPENKIYKWTEKDGLSIFLSPSGFTDSVSSEKRDGSNGLAIDSEGDLVLCQHGDRRLAILKSDFQNPISAFITLTDNYNGKKYNSPNDLAIKSNGDIYFTDPSYGLKNEEKREISYNGVYLLKPNGEVNLLIDSLSMPNGIALSPDEKTIYIANSGPANAALYSFKIDSTGILYEQSLFFDAKSYAQNNVGSFDGLKVHKNGTIFATGPGGVFMLSPKGKLLGIIHTSKATANIAFDSEYKYIYLTTTDRLLRIKLKNSKK